MNLFIILNVKVLGRGFVELGQLSERVRVALITQA